MRQLNKYIVKCFNKILQDDAYAYLRINGFLILGATRYENNWTSITHYLHPSHTVKIQHDSIRVDRIEHYERNTTLLSHYIYYRNGVYLFDKF